MTGPRLADRIRLERRSSFLGRERELERLAAAFGERGPVMTFVLEARHLASGMEVE